MSSARTQRRHAQQEAAHILQDDLAALEAELNNQGGEDLNGFPSDDEDPRSSPARSLVAPDLDDRAMEVDGRNLNNETPIAGGEALEEEPLIGNEDPAYNNDRRESPPPFDDDSDEEPPAADPILDDEEAQNEEVQRMRREIREDREHRLHEQGIYSYGCRLT